jgi:N-glycosylase/DNA lyase
MKEYKAIFKNIDCFDLKQTFTCGQCFRWHENKDSSYTGVIKDGVLNVAKKGKDVVVTGLFDESLGQQDFEAAIKHYLDLDRDYKAIQKQLSKDDKSLKEAISYGEGIRILNQDPWEMLISFITSACNNIPRISKTIENISKMFGKRVISQKEPQNEALRGEFYLFPSPEELKKASVEELRACNLGFRDKYVYEATRSVLEGKLSLESLLESEYSEAKAELLKLNGVGSKVADCILLFSCGKTEAFPVDTWIKKIMNELYIESKDVKKIEQFAHQQFGKYGGIAQQYLFYYKRETS